MIAITLFGLWPCLTPSIVTAAELADCHKLYLQGQYDECIVLASEAIAARAYGEDWRVIKANAELQTGRYRQALGTIEEGLQRYSWSAQLRLQGYRTCLHLGQPARAQELIEEIDKLVGNAPWRYSGVDDLIALGDAALIFGADARSVLEGFYDRAKRAAPERLPPYLASGQLALAKGDDELAADILSDAVKRFPADPDVNFGLARALARSNVERAGNHLARALDVNPSHVPSLMYHVEKFIDSEQYDDAREWLAKVWAINPHLPEAWAARAVIAHLENDLAGEAAFRSAALATWSNNPAVDHAIGRDLSRKYRFAEGAAHQRQAMQFDPNFPPARVQLSQDLLRLGQEDEGWQLASEAHDADGYDTTTFNLLELRDAIAKFRTIETEHFIVRMDPREADIYGQRVLDLLERARETLCGKYGLDLTQPVTVEIFPDENDFAVRTFGMPAVSGFLGVCFGHVITANSPASQADHPSNWESVLWHEFCHVVTLQLTRNKMPRWLSEGISVHEELEQDPRWGQRMTPAYRTMVLNGELTPIGRLSGAFMSPKSSMHLQFAYYEAALVIEFIVDQFGIDALKNVLRDLGDGVLINDALERHTQPLSELEPAFAAFVQQRADSVGRDVDWDDPDLETLLNSDEDGLLDAFLQQHPRNFKAQAALAVQRIEAKQFREAIKPLKAMIELYPEDTRSDSSYLALAGVYRELDDPAAEARTLNDFAKRSADGLVGFRRLLDLRLAAEDWPGAIEVAERILSVNPLQSHPYYGLAEAAGQTGRSAQAVAALRAVVHLTPEDPADVHYRLAGLLHVLHDPAAKRHVLLALEEAPRFRLAHRLLLEIVRSVEKVTDEEVAEKEPTEENVPTQDKPPIER